MKTQVGIIGIILKIIKVMREIENKIKFYKDMIDLNNKLGNQEIKEMFQVKLESFKEDVNQSIKLEV